MLYDDINSALMEFFADQIHNEKVMKNWLKLKNIPGIGESVNYRHPGWKPDLTLNKVNEVIRGQ